MVLAKLAPFSILTGVSMDYLTAADQRSGSFKEFWKSGSSTSSFRTLDSFWPEKPWYWDIFLDELEIFHHMIYASAYTSAPRSGSICNAQPNDRSWLRQKYPKYWDDMDAVWERIGGRWEP